MKNYFLLLILAGVIILAGCNNSNVSSNDSHSTVDFYSNDPHKYSLVVFNNTKSQTNWSNWLESNKITNVNPIFEEQKTLEEAQKVYKTLNIDKFPFYILFDTKGVVFQTSSEPKLIEYLFGN